jgi:hypothetical protein
LPIKYGTEAGFTVCLPAQTIHLVIIVKNIKGETLLGYFANSRR